MIVFDDWLETKRRVDKLTKDAADKRAELKLAMKLVQKAFKCKTLARAKKLQSLGIKKEVAVLNKWNTLYKAFQKRWRKKLKSA
jgi:hypothetical protein